MSIFFHNFSPGSATLLELRIESSCGSACLGEPLEDFEGEEADAPVLHVADQQPHHLLHIIGIVSCDVHKYGTRVLVHLCLESHTF